MSKQPVIDEQSVPKDLMLLFNTEKNKDNPFYWGFVIGYGWGNRPEFIRCSEKEDHTKYSGFTPIVLVKYKSDNKPYEIVKWYNKTQQP